MAFEDSNTVPTGISQMVQSVEQAGQIALTGRDLKISCLSKYDKENKTEEIMQLRGHKDNRKDLFRLGYTTTNSRRFGKNDRVTEGIFNIYEK